MDTMTANFLAKNAIPEAISLRILDFSRPTSLQNPHKNELELMGTFKAFKHLSLECDKQWEEYYKAWNLRNIPSYNHTNEPDVNPEHMWNLIECELVQSDKTIAQHYLKNLIPIKESPELLEKVSNYPRVKWEYQSRDQGYKRTIVNYSARETMKDLVSYIDCLRTCIDRIEQAEQQQSFRLQFSTPEDYEDYLIDEENEQYLEDISTPEGYYDYLY